jgi:hypothetical protein
MSMRRPLLSSVAVVGVLVFVSALVAFAQQSATQKCLNGINKDGANVAKAQGKENTHCLKDAGNAQIPPGTAQSCLTADAKGKVQKKKDKTIALDAASCTPPPGFGYTGAATVNSSGVQGELDLEADVFGGDLDAAVISCATNKPGCKCQQKILGVVEKLADVKLKLFVKCKKAALKAGANAAAALEACVNDAGTPGSIAADTTGKVQKTVVKLDDAILKKCDTPGVTAGAFPGDCTGSSGNTLGTCLDTHVECRVCQILNRNDNLFVDCDLFDDGNANTSCDSGIGPTPTPTATIAPTPTTTPTPGAGFVGALTATTGRFNYNLTLGHAGSDAACSTHWGGSHTGTYAELQTADGANQLVGAVDTSSNAVGSFWAIDGAQPGTRQCFDISGAMINWAYQTVHTSHYGDSVPLTAGHLGALQVGQSGGSQCNFSHGVGCCL